MSQTRYGRLVTRFSLRDLWKLLRRGGRLAVSFTIYHDGRIEDVKFRLFQGSDRELLEWSTTGKWPGSDRPDN